MYPKNPENAREVDGWSAQPQWQFVLSTMVRSSAVKSAAAATAAETAAATAAVRCANRILQINTNTGEVDLIGGCLNFICFQMFTLMFIDLFTF